MDFPVALQLYSVRDDLQANFEGTIQKVAALGYDGVEFAGLYGVEPAAIRAMLGKAGLTALGAHVPFVELIADPEGTLAAYKEIGCSYVAIPYLTPEYRPGSPRFGEVIEGARRIGEAANRAGITLLYHNHDFEFEGRIEGLYPLDYLYKAVPASLLQTELDTCWVKVAGEDPAAYVRKYSGRAPVVHLKDFSGSRQENMYELIGIKGGENKSEGFEFRPVGSGVQDFPAILEASREAGAKWVVVEQDQPSMGKSPMECAEMSIRYLQSL